MDETKRLGQMDLVAAFEEIWKVIESDWKERSLSDEECERRMRAIMARLTRLHARSRREPDGH